MTATRARRPVAEDRRRSDRIIAALAIASALAAPLAGTTLTGWPVLDAVELALYGAVVVVLVAESRRWAWLVTATIAAIAGVGNPVGLGLGVAALAVALVATWSQRRLRRVGAVVGALSAQALLHGGALGPEGTGALLALLAPVPAAVSAWRLQRRETKAVLRRGASWAALGLLLVAVGAVVALLQAMPAARRGEERVTAGVAALNRGDPEEAARQLQLARNAFDESRSAATSPITALSRILPLVNAHLDATADVSRAGADLAGTAATAAEATDYGALGVQDGAIDLDRFDELRPQLQTIEAALVEADGVLTGIDTSLLVEPAAASVEDLSARVEEVLPTTRHAITATELAPTMLGADGPRRWLIAFTTPAETRGIGGFLGYYTEVTADGGELEITDRGRVPDLNDLGDPEARVLEGPEDYLRRYGRFHPERNLQDVPFSPDFPSVATVFESLYEQATGRAVDGMILLDPLALAELLKITGPVTLEDGTELDADAAADYLLAGQYATVDERDERADVLDQIADEVFDRLLSNRLRDPARLIRLLGPMAEQRRVMVHSTHPEEQDLLEAIGLAGGFPEQRPGVDLLAVINQNAGNNKLDTYLERAITYQPRFDPATGATTATVRVRLTNTADPDELPRYVTRNRPDSGQPDGVNWTWLSIHTPLQLTGVTVDGAAASVEPQQEFGWQVYALNVAVPARTGSTEVVFDLEGQLEPGTDYQLLLPSQPLVHPDEVVVELAVPPGWRTEPAGARSLTLDAPSALGWVIEPD